MHRICFQGFFLVFLIAPSAAAQSLVLYNSTVAVPTPTIRVLFANDLRGQDDGPSPDKRLDELDARVESLHLRLITIQRSVELQSVILEEIQSSGTIGGQPIRGRRTVVASAAQKTNATSVHEVPRPDASVPQATDSQQQVQWVQRDLEALLKVIGNKQGEKELKPQIEKVLEALKSLQAGGDQP